MLQRFIRFFSGETYQARAFRGAGFAVTGLIAQNAIRLGSNLILTRLLFPEAFGLMALVMVVLVAAEMFTDVGIRGAIIQHARGLEPAFLNTAWTFQIVRGAVLGAAIFALAEPLSRLYEEPVLAELLRVAALVPLIQGFNSTRLMTLGRELQLGKITFLELGAQALGTLAMIVLAVWLRSVWALVIGLLVGPLTKMILSHLLLDGHANRPGLERNALSALFGFGRFVFLASAAGFLVRMGDLAVLGKFVPLDDLAFYNIGLMLATVPLMVARALSDKVIYPLYARRPPSENHTNKRKIDKARCLLTAGFLVAAVSLAVSGDFLVRLLYDDRYHAAGPLLVLIAVATMPILITESYVKMPLAEGYSDRFAAFQITRAFIQIALMLLMIPAFGLLGAVLAPGLSTLLIYPFLIWTIRPFGGWDPRHDAVFFALAVMLGSVALWINWPVVAPVLEPLFVVR